jgi:hypothetical protein
MAPARVLIMKGAIRPSVLKANEPSPAVDVSSSIGTGDESFSVIVPATGAPVAATPVTIWEDAVTGLVPEADPPPLQPESIRASAASGIAVILNLDLIFSPLSDVPRLKTNRWFGIDLFDISATWLSL